MRNDDSSQFGGKTTGALAYGYAIGDGWRPAFLSYEAPTYFGMLCAAYAR